jgi:1-hydroxycarotenoid 3,4-desaturase
MVFAKRRQLVRTPGVVVIGAGIGGLVAGLHLAARGLAVTIVDSAGAPGGKMRETQAGGAKVDAGPTVLTMLWVFEDILAEVGVALADRLNVRPAQTLARHAWSAAERLDLFADVDRSAEAIADFAGKREADGYRDFCKRARAIYQTLEGSFILGARPSPVSLVQRVGLGGLGGLMRISPFTKLWSALGEHFRDPRLRQLFGRYATYCGSSPFDAPATLMLVAHVEQAGVWTVEGGMHRLAATLADLAIERGATLRYRARAARIIVEGGSAKGVELADGECLRADAVIMNGDVATLSQGLLGRAVAGAAPPMPRRARSLSAVTWAINAKTQGFPLLRHNVFFSADYRAEFDDLFGRARLPRAPTVYVCAQDRCDADAFPNGDERLLCLINAPANGDRGSLSSSELQSCEEATFDLLSRCGLTIARRPGAIVTTEPADFERLFPATGGALYGRSSHGWMASFARPGSRTRLPGLYLAGGSIHPGPGVPMAALSGKQAAASVVMDLVSIGGSNRAVMPGGMSTRSVMTDNRV